MHALQHRGQEASGIVTKEKSESDKKITFNHVKGLGLITDIFKDYKLISEQLKGDFAIGHNRYSTSGSSNNKQNIQPFIVNYRNGNMAIAHNGNLTNFKSHRTRLQNAGTIFQTTSDSELFLHLIAQSSKGNQAEQIMDALSQVDGAFSLLIMTDNFLVAARDIHGFRPLALGKKDNTFIVASETCAFDIINAEYIRDIQPGEVLFIERKNDNEVEMKSLFLENKTPSTHHCIFEYVYFSRPDSKIFGGDTVDKVRRRLGKALAQESPINSGDEKAIVISVPDSSNTATLGYVSEGVKMNLNLKMEIGLIRNHYVGRTFIQPNQIDRELKVKTKYNTVKDVLKDKVVVVIDDSIVRGTTSKKLVKLLREAGPKEIHLKITSPPIVKPCHYGMDFPSTSELIAHQFDGDIEKIREELEVDSLHYLSCEKLLESVPSEQKQGYCTACFGGDYPTKIETKSNKNDLDN